MRGFKLYASAVAAGWMLAVGDAARALGSAIGAIMLNPASPAWGRPAAPLFRVRVGSRLAILEKRSHGTPTRRCSAGHWERIDSAPTPGNAAEWGKLARFWTWYASEVAEGRTPEYSWESDSGKDPNRCGTRPGLAGGRKGKRSPSRLDTFGHAPATGYRVGQTAADAAAERLHRQRIARRERHALRNPLRSACSTCDQFGRHGSHSPGCPARVTQ